MKINEQEVRISVNNETISIYNKNERNIIESIFNNIKQKEFNIKVSEEIENTILKKLENLDDTKCASEVTKLVYEMKNLLLE